MTILDENSLLPEEERKTYFHLLSLYGYTPQSFRLEIKEGNSPLDMNDIDYVILIKIKVTYIETHISKTYLSEAGVGTWLSEFEEDLKEEYFGNH